MASSSPAADPLAKLRVPAAPGLPHPRLRRSGITAALKEEGIWGGEGVKYEFFSPLLPQRLILTTEAAA